MNLKVKCWSGPAEKCDLCDRPIKRYFIDGRTQSGHWALMCPVCFRLRGCGQIGPGRGQLYDKTKDNIKLDKIPADFTRG